MPAPTGHEADRRGRPWHDHRGTRPVHQPSHRNTLHWAASSDDVDVLDALLDAGADIEADGGVIGNSTPLADAVAFGQWNAARRPIDRGAQANPLGKPQLSA